MALAQHLLMREILKLTHAIHELFCHPAQLARTLIFQPQVCGLEHAHRACILPGPQLQSSLNSKPSNDGPRRAESYTSCSFNVGRGQPPSVMLEARRRSGTAMHLGYACMLQLRNVQTSRLLDSQEDGQRASAQEEAHAVRHLAGGVDGMEGSDSSDVEEKTRKVDPHASAMSPGTESVAPPNYNTAFRKGQVPLDIDSQVEEMMARFLRKMKQDETSQQYATTYKGISSEIFFRGLSEFHKFAIRGMSPELHEYMKWASGQNSRKNQANRLLSSFFMSFTLHRFRDEISDFRRKVSAVDLRAPHTWFSAARAVERTIIYHAGPTNSGKTYNALEALKNVSKGLYCAPLRLLAVEVYDTLNQAGVPCSLMTGEDARTVPGAQHVSCTVEMANLNRRYDVAVLDEIQMIADPQRGCAWTRALLGLPANEMHLCGDASALPLIKKICDVTKEKLEIKKYQRHNNLQIEPDSLIQVLHKEQLVDEIRGKGVPSALQGESGHALGGSSWSPGKENPSGKQSRLVADTIYTGEDEHGQGRGQCTRSCGDSNFESHDSHGSPSTSSTSAQIGGAIEGSSQPSPVAPSTMWSSIQPGDCVVAFRKLDLLKIKAAIETSTPHKVCIIYGALPPETRRSQAALFNDPDSGYDVLVASDAVGLGLNLNIRRIVFTTLEKNLGDQTVRMPDSMIRQIAGRAGRKSSCYPIGYVTATDSLDLSMLHAALHSPLKDAVRAALTPEPEHVELLAATMPGHSLPEVLQEYSRNSQLDGNYFFGNMESALEVAKLLDLIHEMSLPDRVRFCAAPVRLNRPGSPLRESLLLFASNFAAGAPVHAPQFEVQKLQDLEPYERLAALENCYQVLMLWIWLANRFKRERKSVGYIQNALASVEGSGEDILDHPQFPGRNVAKSMADQVIQALHTTMYGMFRLTPPRSKRVSKKKSGKK